MKIMLKRNLKTMYKPMMNILFKNHNLIYNYWTQVFYKTQSSYREKQKNQINIKQKPLYLTKTKIK